MADQKESITSRQLMTLLLSAQIGLGILTFPSDIAKVAGHDSWISVLLGGLVFLVLSLLLVLLMRRYKDQTIIDINRNLYGSFVGTVINVAILLYFCVSTVNGIRLYCEFIKLTVLTNTPPVVLTCFIMLPIFYMTWCGLKCFARFSVLNYFGLLVTLDIILMMYKEYRVGFLLPVGSSGIPSIFQGIFSTVYAMLGPELLIFFFPYVTDQKKSVLYVTVANLVTTAFYTLVLLSTTALFGENMLKKLVIPLIVLSRTYYAPIFERIDLFYFAIWVPNIALSTGVYFIGTHIGIRSLLRNKKHEKLQLILFTVIAIALSRIPSGLNAESTIMTVISISGLMVIGIAIADYVASFFLKRGVK